MSGPSTMAHHNELHKRIRELEAEALRHERLWREAVGERNRLLDRAVSAEARLAEAEWLLRAFLALDVPTAFVGHPPLDVEVSEFLSSDPAGRGRWRRVRE